MKRSLTYPAADIPDNVKTILGGQYISMRNEGMTREKFLAHLSASGLSVSARQLDRWVANIKSEGTALSSSRARGRDSRLDREQKDVACGWVLSQIFEGVPVHRESYSE